jgi:hypothetical protein
MGWARDMYEEKYRCIQDFGGETFREKIHLEDLGVDGRIILKCIFKKGERGKDGMDRAQDTDV